MAKLNSTTFPVLTSNALSRLHSKKIYTVVDFVLESNENLVKFTELPFKDILNLRKLIHVLYGGIIKKASDLLINDRKIPTGIKNFDILLNGGFCTGYIYEICGIPSSGKSQLCHTIATNVAFNLSQNVHYIDTKGDFCATRIFLMLQCRKCGDKDISRVMKSIQVSRVANIDELMTLLYNLSSSLKSKTDENSTSVLIIDSLPALFLKSPKDNDATVALNHVANVCKFIANQCRIIVVTVNMITKWREIDGFSVKECNNPVVIKPSLGKYWLHIPDTRFLMEQLNNEERKISVWNSTQLKLDCTCLINITNLGVI